MANIRRALKCNKKYATINKKSGRRAATAKLKEDLRTDPQWRQRFKQNIDEVIHLKAGGRSRIADSMQRVEAAEENFVDV
eukprot:9822596-Alexandrium_andersonii.AAC.1